MPTPPLPDDLARQALAAFEEHGQKKAAAKALGVPYGTFTKRLMIARSRGMHLDAGIQDAIQRTGLSAMTARHGWRKETDPETGLANSVFWKSPGVDLDSLKEALADAFHSLPTAQPAASPQRVLRNLCTYYVIADHHLAMRSWARETGEDYDLSDGVARLRSSVAALAGATPESAEAVILNLGDFFHADNSDNETWASKHKLDVDGRYYKVIDAGVQVTVDVIEACKRKHRRVRYRGLRGNHDPHAHVALTVALAAHYRNDDRVTIEPGENDYFVHEWGRNMVGAHHGDKSKPDRLVMFLADNWPEIWGRTHWRYMWTGHIHHDSAKDIGGVKWESFRTLAPKDAWATGGAYSSRQSMQAVTLDRDVGEVMRNVVNIIPPKWRAP